MQEDCILPVRFDDTEIPGIPSTINYVDLRYTTEEELAELTTLKVNPEKAFNNEDEESVDPENEQEESYPEVLHSEINTLKPDTHIAYACDLEAGETTEYEIESEKEIDVLLMDKKDYKIWAKTGEAETY